MNSGIDISLISEYYRRMSNSELIQVISSNLNGLTEAGLDIIKAEINYRKLDPKYLKIVEDQQFTFQVPEKFFDPDSAPVDDEVRIAIENSFKFLLDAFGYKKTIDRKILLPERKFFPYRFDGSEESAIETLRIITTQMEVPFDQVKLDFYDANLQNITDGNPGGMYWGKGEHDLFEISVARPHLNEPEDLIPILAHEVAHIKLLGENRIAENDEPLTDMATIFFGFGVFNANAVFRMFADNKYHGWTQSGYLSQMEWGYALSLFSLIRKEENPG